jgi:hypothetical protein
MPTHVSLGIRYHKYVISHVGCSLPRIFALRYDTNVRFRRIIKKEKQLQHQAALDYFVATKPYFVTPF